MNYGRQRKNPETATLRIAIERAAGRRFALEEDEDDRGPLVRVRHGALTTVLRPYWAGQGFRKDVEAARAAMRDAGIPAEDVPVIAARRLPRTTRRDLENDGLSWVDEVHGARVFSPSGLAVVVEHPAAPPRHDLDLKWTEALGAVAEYVLGAHSVSAQHEEHGAVPGVVDIAAALQLAPSIVSRAVRMFDAQGWTRKQGPERGPGARREMVDPGGMLTGWAGWYRAGRTATIQAHGLIRNYERFLDRGLPHAWKGTWWLATGAAAADRRAPYLTSVPQVDLYLDSAVFDDGAAIDDLLARADLRVVDSGARVRIHRSDRFLRAVTRAAAAPDRQVGDIRLYGDLLRVGGRAEEAAEHLRETRIGF